MATFTSHLLHRNLVPSKSSQQASNFRPKQVQKKYNHLMTGIYHSTYNASAEGDGDKTKVAIIGGDIAGLSCAAHLTSVSSNFEATVFDTGRLRSGGRCSSRMPGDPPKEGVASNSKGRLLSNFIVDHAAQILTVPTGLGSNELNAFRDQVEEWERLGVVKRFPPGSVVDILPNGKQQQNTISCLKVRILNDRNVKSGQNKVEYGPSMYYGVNGMGSIPAAIAFPKSQLDKDASSSSTSRKSLFRIEQDVWISPSNGVKFSGSGNCPKWTVQTNKKKFGSFDRIVIAHNGKCADRLMSSTLAKAFYSLLPTNFAPSVPAWSGKRMTLNSIYPLTIAIKKEMSPIAQVLGQDMISVFIKNESSLRFMTCQTRKHPDHQKRFGRDDVEVWTILSSAKSGEYPNGKGA